jgi:hypothetical protein
MREVTMENKVVRFPNGVIVDLRPRDHGRPVFAVIDGSWVPAEGNPKVLWDDLKDARALSDEEIAALPRKHLHQLMMESPGSDEFPGPEMKPPRWPDTD